MPTFEVSAPDGHKYRVETPEGATEQDAINYIKRQLASQPAKPRGPGQNKDAGFWENVGAGLGSGAVGLYESAALGLGAALPEEYETPVRDTIKSVADAISPDGGDAESVTYNLASGIGSILGGLPLAMLGPAGVAAGAALYGGSGAGEASERARAAGATEEERTQAALEGLIPGAIDVIPQMRMARFFPKIVSSKLGKAIAKVFGDKEIKGIKSRMASMAATGSIEGMQETAQEVLQNMIQRGYDPEQDLGEGLIASGGYGAGAGAIVQGIIDVFLPGKSRGGSNLPDDVENLPSPTEQQDLFGGAIGSVDETGQIDMFGAEQDRRAPPPAQKQQNERQGDLFDIAPEQADIVEAADAETLQRTVDLENTGQRDMFPREALAALEEASDPEIDGYGAEIERALEGDPGNKDLLLMQRVIAAEKNRRASGQRMPNPLLGEQTTIFDAIKQDKAREVDEAGEYAPLNREESFAKQRAIEDEVKAKQDAAKAEVEQQRIADLKAQSEAESERLANRQQQPDAMRAAVLDNIIETNKSQNYFAVLKDYADQLRKNNVADTTPTNEEVARIQRAINLQFAEPEQQQTEAPAPAEPSTGAPTSQILAFPEITPKQPPETNRRKSDVQEEPRPITKGLLDSMGVAPKAPLRKRITGKDAADPANFDLISKELMNYANNPAVPIKTTADVLARNTARQRIPAFLRAIAPVENTQMEMFGPRGGVTEEAKQKPQPKKVKADGQQATASDGGGTGAGTEAAAPNAPVGTTTTTAERPAASPAPSGERGVGNDNVDVAPAGRAESSESDTLKTKEKAKTEVAKPPLEGQLVDEEGTTEADKIELDKEQPAYLDKDDSDDVEDLDAVAYDWDFQAMQDDLFSPTKHAEWLVSEWDKNGTVRDNIDSPVWSDDQRTALKKAAGYFVKVEDKALPKPKAEQKVKKTQETTDKTDKVSEPKEVKDKDTTVGPTRQAKKAEKAETEPSPAKESAEKETGKEKAEAKYREKIKIINEAPDGVAAKYLTDEWGYLNENPSNPLTIEDHDKLVKLLDETPKVASKKAMTDAQAAVLYFKHHVRAIDGITDMVYDAVFGSKTGGKLVTGQYNAGAETTASEEARLNEELGPFETTALDNKFLEGKNYKNAVKAVRWVNENLSNAAREQLNDKSRQTFEWAANIAALRNTRMYLTLEEAIEEGWKEYNLREEAQKAKEQRIKLASEIRDVLYGGKSDPGRSLSKAEIAALEASGALAEMNRRVEEKGQSLAEEKTVDELSDTYNKLANKKSGPSRRTRMSADMGAKSLLERFSEFRLSDEYNLTDDALTASAIPLPPLAHAALKNGELGTALNILVNSLDNKLVRRFATKLYEVVGDTKVEVVKNLRNESGNRVAGLFDPKTNTIKIDDRADISSHVLLHEMAHAAVSKTLANKSHPLTKKLTKLFNAVKDDLDTAYGATNLDEFASEAMSNVEFQQKLASLYAERGNNIPAWKQFINTVVNFLRQKLGLGQKQTSEYAQLNELLEALMAPAPESRNAGQLNMMALTGKLKEVGKWANDVYAIEQRLAKHTTATDFALSVYNFFTRRLPYYIKQGFAGFMHSHALAEMSRMYGFGELGQEMHDIYNKADADLANIYNTLDAVQKELSEYRQRIGDKKYDAFSELVHNSTRVKVDPYKPKSDYKGEQAKNWQDMQEWVDEIGPEGKAMYTQLKGAYKKLYEQLERAIYAKIDMIGDESSKYRLRTEVFEKLFADHKIDPFFPLARKGDYWLTYNVEINNKVEKVVEAFDSAKRREIRMGELEKAGGHSEIIPFHNPNENLYDRTVPGGFVADVMEMFDLQGVDKETQEMFTRMYINTLPASSYAKGMAERKGTLGFILDPLEAFQLRAYDIARNANEIQSSELITTKMREINNKAKELGTDGEDMIEVIRKEWAMRSNFAISPPNTWVSRAARAANRYAFLGTIGFNLSSAAVNLSQIPMVVMPYLAGKTNLKTAYGSLNAAWKLFRTAGTQHEIEMLGADGKTKKVTSYAPSIDNYYIARRNDKTGAFTLEMRDDVNWGDNPNAEFYNGMTKQELVEYIKPLVEAMMNNSQLNRTLFYDSLGAELSNKQKGVFDYISAYSAFPFHITERSNRQVAIIGAYLNEMARFKDPNKLTTAEKAFNKTELQEHAVKQALMDAQMTNGGSHLTTAPRWAQKDIGRVAMMYKAFGINMYYMQFMTFKRSLKALDKDPDVQKAARAAMKQYWGIQGAVTLLSGVSGLTMYGILAGMYNTLLKDDDDEDFETLTRKAIGEEWYKGGINAASAMIPGLGEGVDVSSRIGLSNLLVGSNKYDFDPSLEKSILRGLGGPAYGFTSQQIRGVQDIFDGEIQRGVENIMPSAFRNVLKATGRYRTEGALTRRGDPIMGEIGGGLLAAQFFGFAPAEYTRKQEQNQVYKGIEKSANEERTKLLKQRYLAIRMGDYDELKEVMEKIMEYNRKHPINRIDVDAMDSSLKQHMKTTQQMHNGVLFSPKMRQEIQPMMDDWDF